MAHRRAPRINTLYFTPNERIMSRAEVLFWLGHNYVFSQVVLLGYNDFSCAVDDVCDIHEAELTYTILSILPSYSQLGLSSNFIYKALMFKCHPDILQSYPQPSRDCNTN